MNDLDPVARTIKWLHVDVGMDTATYPTEAKPSRISLNNWRGEAELIIFKYKTKPKAEFYIFRYPFPTEICNPIILRFSAPFTDFKSRPYAQ